MATLNESDNHVLIHLAELNTSESIPENDSNKLCTKENVFNLLQIIVMILFATLVSIGVVYVIIKLVFSIIMLYQYFIPIIHDINGLIKS